MPFQSAVAFMLLESKRQFSRRSEAMPLFEKPRLRLRAKAKFSIVVTSVDSVAAVTDMMVSASVPPPSSTVSGSAAMASPAVPA